jgi:hypothetical protein
MRAAAIAFALALGLSAAPALAVGVIPAGSNVFGTLDTDLNTANASVGDGFSLSIERPYPNDDPAYANSYVRGHVAKVVKAGQGTKAELDLAFDALVMADGTSSPITGHVVKVDTKQQSAIPQQAIGALAGMIVGNVIGKTVLGSNMHLGGLAGAAGGFLYGNNVKTNFTVPKGSTMTVQTDQEVQRPQAQHSSWQTPAPTPYPTPTGRT